MKRIIFLLLIFYLWFIISLETNIEIDVKKKKVFLIM